MISKKLKIKYYWHLITAQILLVAATASASDYGQQAAAQKAGLTSIKGAEDIPSFLGTFAGAALALSGSIFLFLIIYGGIIIMTAAGSMERVKKGKDVIVWAVVGALILGASYAITSLVFSLFQKPT